MGVNDRAPPRRRPRPPPAPPRLRTTAVQPQALEPGTFVRLEPGESVSFASAGVTVEEAADALRAASGAPWRCDHCGQARRGVRPSSCASCGAPT